MFMFVPVFATEVSLQVRSPGSRDRTSSGGSGSRGREEDFSDDYDYFLVETTGQRIPLLQAIDIGWVFVEYDDDNEDALEQQVWLLNLL